MILSGGYHLGPRVIKHHCHCYQSRNHLTGSHSAFVVDQTYCALVPGSRVISLNSVVIQSCFVSTHHCISSVTFTWCLNGVVAWWLWILWTLMKHVMQGSQDSKPSTHHQFTFGWIKHHHEVQWFIAHPPHPMYHSSSVLSSHFLQQRVASSHWSNFKLMLRALVQLDVLMLWAINRTA